MEPTWNIQTTRRWSESGGGVSGGGWVVVLVTPLPTQPKGKTHVADLTRAAATAGKVIPRVSGVPEVGGAGPR